jgi:hypothetical protein
MEDQQQGTCDTQALLLHVLLDCMQIFGWAWCSRDTNVWTRKQGVKCEGMERNHSRRNHVNARNLPGELLEQVLAHVPFRDR